MGGLCWLKWLMGGFKWLVALSGGQWTTKLNKWKLKAYRRWLEDGQNALRGG